jgi:hypothetical protein
MALPTRVPSGVVVMVDLSPSWMRVGAPGHLPDVSLIFLSTASPERHRGAGPHESTRDRSGRQG